MARSVWNTPRIVPGIAYKDVAKAAEWLSRAFGFRERIESRLSGTIPGRGDWFLTWIELDDGLIGLNTAGSGRSDCNGLKVYVDDIDRHFERAKAAGATITAQLEDKFWGGREYAAKDLEGHDWEFSARGRELASADWKLPPGVKRHG